jgi:hypothetical protein
MNEAQKFEKECDALVRIEKQKYYPTIKGPLPPKKEKPEPPIQWTEAFKLDERKIQVEYETPYPKKKYFFKKQDQEPEQFWYTLGGTNIQYQISSECHH